MGEGDEPRIASHPYGTSEPLLGGKYELVEAIGQGGMASVWLGMTHGEAGFRRKIAVKRVLQHLSHDTKFEAMFVEEAHIVAGLNHPNIVQIHDFGREREGGYFIVMEWVEGLNLVDYVRAFARINERPAWPLCCAIAIEVLRALSAAHQRCDSDGRPVPVIHRDVTPANILIGDNGCVKLTDFGLSRAMDRPRTTDPGTVKGKVAYIAPEVLDGEKADTRCDIYAVGVVLWEAVCAQRLFGGHGTDVDIALRVLEGKIPWANEINPNVPAELDEILNRALARRPSERYPRATAMIEALAALLRKQELPTDGQAIARSVRDAKELLLRSSSVPSKAPGGAPGRSNQGA